MTVDEPIHLHFEVPADEAHRLLGDPEFMERARRLLHDQAGGCYWPPRSCYDLRHRPAIETEVFLRRLFGLDPEPDYEAEYGKR